MAAWLPSASAEQKQDFGDYVVHYSAQNTSELSAEVARQYGITRSHRQAMVVIAVQKKTGAPMPEAVSAVVKGQARNLLGQAQALAMREIREGPAIYYLAVITVGNLDTQTFELEIQPAGVERIFKLRFSQKFYVD